MNRPKYSLGSWAFSFGPFERAPWSFERFLKYCAGAGYDGIEINGFHPHPHPDVYNTGFKCKELKKIIEGYGLGISGYAPDFRDVPPAIVPLRDHIRAVEKSLAFCNHMGINTLRVDTISPPAELEASAYHQRFNHLATTWNRAAEVCQSAGVKLVWEFEPGFWLNKPSEILSIVEAVDHENFKLLFDTSHAYMCAVEVARQVSPKETLPGGIVELARKLEDHIGHLHLIDSDGTLHDEETSTHAPFGTGSVDFVEVLFSIKNTIEALPWWCFDFCFCPSTEADAKKAIPFVNNIIQQIA